MSDLSVHALSAGELAYLRTRPQRTDLRMAVHLNPHVYTVRVNGAPASGDRVYEVDYDRDGLGAGVPADFANCIDDLTVLVGTTIGGAQRGIVRLRGFAGGSDETSGTMLIGEDSEVAWGDNLLLTIVDEFNLWPRHIYINPATEVVYMDRDVVYTDQHQYPDPVPVLGPDAALEYDGELGGANTIEVDFDASDSWALDGGALTYSWTATGASATVNMATATPTVAYDAPGIYRVDCIVSRDYGGGNISTFTGHRYVYVFDDSSLPILKFELLSCDGDYRGGGWTCRVKLWDEATLAEVYDRCKVTIFASDVYGSTSTSIGPIYSANHGLLRANTIFSGWIAGESIVFDNEDGSVEFEIHGPHYWFNKMTTFPHGIQDYNGVPDAWYRFEDLTVDKGLWAFLHWRSTATRMMDVYLTGDAREIPETRNDIGTLWSQMVRSAEDTILANPCCDRYGRLFIEIHANLVPIGDRGAIPIIMQILRQDWREEISIERRIMNVTGMIDVSGVGYADGTATPYFSLSFGHIFGHYGDVSKRDRLALFANQADNNELAGLLLGMINNEYPNVDHRMAANNRSFDVCPQQYLTQAIAVTDTERGIEWSPAMNLLPRRVSFRYDKEEGVLLSDVTSEAETVDVEAITGDPPVTPPDPEPPDLPDPPIPPPLEPPVVPILQDVFILTTQGIYFTRNFEDALPTWVACNNSLTNAEKDNIVEMAYDRTMGYLYMINHLGAYRCTDPFNTGPWTQVHDNAYVGTQLDAAGGACTPWVGPGSPGYFSIAVNRVSSHIVLIAGIDGCGGCDSHQRSFYSTDQLTTISVGDDFHNSNPATGDASLGIRQQVSIENGVAVYSEINGWAQHHGFSYRSLDAGITIGDLDEQLLDSLISSCGSSAFHGRTNAKVLMHFEGVGASSTFIFKENSNGTPSYATEVFDHSVADHRNSLKANRLNVNYWMVLAASGPSSIAHKTTDDGATYGHLVAHPGGASGKSRCVTDVGRDDVGNDGERFIFGQYRTARFVDYTTDMGNTMVDKTGNLDTWLSTAVDHVIQIIPLDE